ncbi:hypothetical protein [Actinomadura luteofluorescens]|uniref:hypothetical protein n=1 Tax=Actinomadura luteofluorescens TaxID=46163 RepID=UPI0030CF340F
MTTSAFTPVFELTSGTNRNPPTSDFEAQTAQLRRVAHYNDGDRTWTGRVTAEHLAWGAQVITELFDAARAYGTSVTVQHIETARETAGERG